MNKAFLKKLESGYLLDPILTLAFLMAFIGFWSTLYLNIHLDIDIAWLLQCLERFLNGGTYTQDFYETNPPLSFLIYLPAYPLYAFLGLSVKPSILITFFIYIAISNITLFKLLQKTPLPPPIIMAVICAILTAQTWGTGMNFGLKDHLIFVFLTPLCLYQYLLTAQTTTIHKSISVPATIMGGIALCLKPHYAIIPATFILHRLIKTKSIKPSIISTDTIGLILCGIAYILFIYMFTPDFISTILPEVSSLYGIDQPFPMGMNLKSFAITIISVLVGYITITITRNEDRSQIIATITAFALLSTLCVIPYLLQNKGFFYHTVPFLGFGIAAMCMAIYSMALLVMKDKDITLWITLALTATLTYANTSGGKTPVMTTGQYKAQPLIDYIDEHAWNRVYATYDMKSMLAPLPYIIGVQSGSRYGQIWNLHALSILSSHPKNEAESEEIKNNMQRIIDTMAQDIHTYKPSVIAIPLYPTNIETHDPSHKYYEFLMANDDFANAMKNYTKEDTIKFNKSLTLNDTDENNIVWHDVYVLKQDHSL
ncbi:MAG: hypothetical protein ACRBDI_00090 [Alphaproteobacteria bacterium]